MMSYDENDNDSEYCDDHDDDEDNVDDGGKSGSDEKWGEMIRSDDSRTQKNELYASPAVAYILTPTI